MFKPVGESIPLAPQFPLAEPARQTYFYLTYLGDYFRIEVITHHQFFYPPKDLPPQVFSIFLSLLSSPQPVSYLPALYVLKFPWPS